MRADARHPNITFHGKPCRIPLECPDVKRQRENDARALVRALRTAPAAKLQAGKAVGGPLLAANTVVNKEEPFGVVLAFDGGKSRIIGAPKGMLP